MIPCTKILTGKATVHSNSDIGPLFVWNITEKCNLRCAHCYRESDEFSHSPATLSDEKCFRLIDEIKQLNPPIVLLSGGEPLLRKNIFDIIQRCIDAGLRVGLSTNGTLISPEIARKIKEARVSYVGISIDGMEEGHDSFRGTLGAFSSSWKAIGFLNDVGVKTGVRFTLTNSNSGDLLKVLEKTIESGVKRFCLYHLVYSGRGTQVEDLSVDKKREIMEEFFKKVESITEKHKEVEVLTTDNHSDGIYLALHHRQNPESVACISAHGGCSAGSKVVYLDSTGIVYPCQFLRDEPMGDVRKDSLLDIWKNDPSAMTLKFRNKKDFLTGKCGQCAHKDICGGCRARAKAISGSLWSEDSACYLTAEETAKSLVDQCLEDKT